MEQHDFLRLLAGCLEALGVRYFITGSIASMAYGEPRLTNDIDVVADLGIEHVAEFRRRFPAPEFYLSEEAAREAVQRRGQFNIIHPSSGLKADIIIPEGDAFDDSRFRRVKRIRPVEDMEVDFASPEDVIIKKLLFHREGGSEKHLRDVAGMLRVSADALDLGYIEEWADRLGVRDAWDRIVGRAAG